jgi:hypothetical protein
LLGLLEKMPAGATLSLAPLLHRHQEVQEEIATTLAMLNQIQSATDLQELLEAGTLARQLAIRAGLTAPDNWTTNRLPDVITRLLDVAEQRQGWSELHDAYLFLMDSARQFAALEDPERRRLYLTQAARVLAAGRRTALALWQEKVSLGLADFRWPRYAAYQPRSKCATPPEQFATIDSRNRSTARFVVRFVAAVRR